MQKKNEEIPFQKFDLAELPPLEQQKVLNEIGENEESRKFGLQDLKNRIKEEKNFKPCIEDDFLLRFLRTAKFNCDKAYTRLKKFYEMKRKHPDYVEKCAESAIKRAHLNAFYAGPYRNKDNSVIFIDKYFYSHPEKLPVIEKFYLEMLAFDVLLENPINQMCGVTLVEDCSGINVSTLLYYTPKLFKFQAETSQGVFPIRIKAIHCINMPSLCCILYNIVYPFMSKKLKERIHFHSDSKTFKDLHAFVPPEVLPEEYGGCLKESELINVMDDLKEKEKKFLSGLPNIHA